MTEMSGKSIEFSTKLLRDGETFGVRYVCECGCRPQVRLRRDAAAAHEHCCCGIAHAAGPDARSHLDSYLAERKAAGEDVDRSYLTSETTVNDPWGDVVVVAYAVPVPLTTD